MLVVYTISDIIAIFDLFVAPVGRARCNTQERAPQVAELEQRVGALDPTWCVKEERQVSRVSRSKYGFSTGQTTRHRDAVERTSNFIHSSIAFITTPKHRSIEPPIRLLTHHRSLPVHSFATSR